MMRVLFLLLVSALVVFGQDLEACFHPAKKRTYVQAAPNWHWQADGGLLEWSTAPGFQLRRIDLRTGMRTPLLDADGLKARLAQAGAPNPTIGAPEAWTEAGDAFLIRTEGGLYFVPLNGQVRRLIAATSELELPTFSPDGSKLAFRRRHDLWVLDLASGREIPLTRDGSPTRLHGRLDWVYEEELYGRGKARAFWWSPDSSRLAFLSSDTSAEPVHTLVDDRSQPHITFPIRYPKAGDPGAVVKLAVADLAGRLEWLADPHPGQETLIVQVGWDPGGRLWASYQDRWQTWLELRRFDGASSTLLIRETSPAWQDRLPLPRFLKNGRFLWHSDRTGYRHLYLCEGNGTIARPLTAGSWDVRSLDGVDEKTGEVFFSGTERSPLGLDAYAVSLNGRGPNAGLRRLTERPGTHTVTFAPDLARFLDTWSDAQTPTRTLLVARDGKTNADLFDEALESWHTLKRGQIRFQTLPTRDGGRLESLLILPPDFDPTRRYPVYQEVYGGPHAPLVKNAFGRINTQLWHHFLARQGYIVWICDPRTASNQGPASAYPAHRKLGQLELRDLEDGLAWLKAQGWADMERIALEGWSYGGFLTLRALTHSRLWKAGLAGAAVTDFRLYDSVYTERYMGLPKDNPEGYGAANLLKAAANLHGRLLLLHGTLDDNVHPQNTIQMIDALQKAGQDFELVLFPGAGHGTRSPEHIWARYRKSWDFLQRSLQLPASASQAP